MKKSHILFIVSAFMVSSAPSFGADSAEKSPIHIDTPDHELIFLRSSEATRFMKAAKDKNTDLKSLTIYGGFAGKKGTTALFDLLQSNTSLTLTITPYLIEPVHKIILEQKYGDRIRFLGEEKSNDTY